MNSEFYPIREVPSAPTAVLLEGGTIGLLANSKLYRSGKTVDRSKKVEAIYDEVQRIASDMLGALQLAQLECDTFSLDRPDGKAMLNVVVRAALVYKLAASSEWHADRSTPLATMQLENTLGLFVPGQDQAAHGLEEVDPDRVEVEQVMGGIHHLDESAYLGKMLPKLTQPTIKAIEPFPSTPVQFPLLGLQRAIFANMSADNTFVSAPADALAKAALTQGLDSDEIAALVASNMSGEIVEVAKEASSYGRRE